MIYFSSMVKKAYLNHAQIYSWMSNMSKENYQ